MANPGWILLHDNETRQQMRVQVTRIAYYYLATDSGGSRVFIHFNGEEYRADLCVVQTMDEIDLAVDAANLPPRGAHH